MRRFTTTLSLAAFAVALAMTPASAQRADDQGYGKGSRFGEDFDRRDNRNDRDVPGEFDYYALVLSWSPTFCATEAGDNNEMQCGRRDGRRYAFVLHGLWPQYERGFPGSCFVAKHKLRVPQDVLDGMLDIMPAPGLVIHEWKKHGTCSGLDAREYYQISRKLYNSVAIPERFVNPFENQITNPDEILAEFEKANPDFPEGSIAISCGGSGNRLKEIRVCMTKDGKPRTCGKNEDQRRLCSAQRVFVPPVRNQRPDLDGEKPQRPAGKEQPRPKLIEGVRGI
jgi:ribonuclease T2